MQALSLFKKLTKLFKLAAIITYMHYILTTQCLFFRIFQRGGKTVNLEMKGGHMRFLDVDTCLSTKFQGGANAPLRPPP